MMTFSISCAMLVVLFVNAKATLTFTPTVACPDDTVNFTCTLPGIVSSSLRWTVARQNGLDETGSVNNNVPTRMIGSDGFMFQAVFFGLSSSGDMVTSTLTTLTMVTALTGATVQCSVIGGGSVGPIPISVAGE